MKELVIASNNSGKITEIKSIIEGIQLLSLNDIGFVDEVAEPFHTFHENALAKASTIHHFCGKNVFADESGLCVPALQLEPGVQSAYYGGLPRSDAKNNQRLLEELKIHTDRSAFYSCVICLIWERETYYFEGTCEGSIAHDATGTKGFGYDPLFIPNGYEESFGVLPLTIKNTLSHRGKAVRKMVDFLKDKID